MLRMNRHGWGRFQERVFGKGDLKYIILDLLTDKPRHGYDIIRALEDRFGGFYAPSPGAVYPTLQMLEDMGAVVVEQQDGKKVYTITEHGRVLLQERKPLMDDLRDRWHAWAWDGTTDLNEAMRELGDAMRAIGRAGGRIWTDPEKRRRMGEVIANARREMEAILHED